MDANVTLYGFPGSLCSQKVRLALAEKRVPYRSRIVDIELRLQNYEPWYMRLNPRGVVPTLVHGDRVVTDSARILRYVDETFEGPPLVPDSSDGRERMTGWIDQQDRLRMRELSYASFRGALGLVLRRVSMPLRLSKLRRLRDANSDLAQLYQAKIDDVREWRAAIAKPVEIAGIRRELEVVLRRAERQLGECTHLAGDDYSLADVAWTCVLARLEMTGLAPSLWAGGRSPRLEAYYARLCARPSFTKADVWNAMPRGRARLALIRSIRAGSRAEGRER